MEPDTAGPGGEKEDNKKHGETGPRAPLAKAPCNNDGKNKGKHQSHQNVNKEHRFLSFLLAIAIVSQDIGTVGRR
jgi:hypothetical protein